MDATKWKSVVIPIRSYELLKRMAKAEHRTISGQFTYMLQQGKKRREQGDQTMTAVIATAAFYGIVCVVLLLSNG